MTVYHLVFLLSLAWRSRGIPTSLLTIHPEDPLVERGGSIRLTCSMDCPSGKVEWKGLDTDLGNIVSNATYSVLTVANATVDAEGEKSCVGQCWRVPYWKKVELQVYSFPETLRLTSQPETPRADQPACLSCSVSHIYPPGSLTLSWFRGGEKLEAPVEEKEMGDSDEQLFAYRSVLEVPRIVAGTAYRCQVTLEVGRRTFHQEKEVNIAVQAAQEVPDVTEEATVTFMRTTPGTSSEPPTRTQRPSSLATSDGRRSVLRSTQGVAGGASKAATTVASALSVDSDTTLGSSPRFLSPAENPVTDLTTKSLRAKIEASRHHDVTLTLPPVTSRLSPLTGAQATPKTVSTSADLHTPRVPTEKPHVPTLKGRCHPAIKPVPSQGTAGKPLHITCRALECGDRVTIRWVETPVAQSQYGLAEADGRSTLAVDSVGREHQGVYRCVVLGSQAQMASVHLVVSDAMFSADSIAIAVGTAGSLLGLAITGYVFRRAWHRRWGKE